MDLKEYQETGRLNLSGFTNLEKAVMSHEDFNKEYVASGKYEIYAENTISEFQKAIANDLVKGEIGADELKKSQSDLSHLKHVQFRNAEGNAIGAYVREKVEKGVDDELEKGMINESFGSYSNNKLSFSKTGKQINTQITTVLLPLLEAQKVQMTALLTTQADGITVDPDDNVDQYEYRGFAAILPKVGRYSWSLCDNPYDSTLQKSAPITDEQKLMRLYNQTAQKLVSTMADIAYATLLARNIEDNKKYELTSDQVLALQF